MNSKPDFAQFMRDPENDQCAESPVASESPQKRQRVRRLPVPGKPIMRKGEGRTVRILLPDWLIIRLDRKSSEDYVSRGRSRWVDEALLQLIQYPSWRELLFAQSIPVPDMRIRQFKLSPRGAEALDSAIRAVREEDPFLEGVISEIIRTAISQRLLRSPGGIGDLG